MPKITISYRRADSLAITGRIFDNLVERYGHEAVFMDLESIALGTDFREAISQAFTETSVLLVIIGRRWLADGRINHEADWVRAEIRTALAQNIPIIPVLVDGAPMPSVRDLPADIHEFSYRQAAPIESGRRFREQMDRLLREIDKFLGGERGRSWWLSTLKKSETVAPSRPIPVVPTSPRAVEPKPVTPAPRAVAPTYARTSPEYWLNRVAVERKLPPGDEPLVMISYASEDQAWITELRSFLDRRVEQLRDTNGRSYELWNFSDVKRGTVPGDEFPEIVAEKMWRCRVALVVLSKDYFNSRYCRTIELPFLMWRRGQHGLICLPIKLGTLPADAVRLPAYEHPSRKVMLEEIIDDRQAPEDFMSSPYRELSMKQLKERGLESEIENRFDGLSRQVFAYLKTRYEAVEED